MHHDLVIYVMCLSCACHVHIMTLSCTCHVLVMCTLCPYVHVMCISCPCHVLYLLMALLLICSQMLFSSERVFQSGSLSSSCRYSRLQVTALCMHTQCSRTELFPCNDLDGTPCHVYSCAPPHPAFHAPPHPAVCSTAAVSVALNWTPFWVGRTRIVVCLW